MNKFIVGELIKKYREGTCTDQEKAIVESWYLQQLKESDAGPSAEKISLVNQRMEKAIFGQMKPEHQPHRLVYRLSIAAAILVLLSVGWYFLPVERPPAPPVAKQEVHDALPGNNKAILTLNNGRKIILASAKNGLLADQGSIVIRKTANDRVVYQQNGSTKGPAAMAYNTISTPRGGQWKLTLSDGSQVWLNAGSTIRYPTIFSASTREVEITGEAYFEVVKDKHRAFRVKSNGQTIEVLGTHFNVNAYSDEQVTRTTLLEGSIKIIKGTDEQLIKPGQQALTKVTENKIIVQDQVNLAAEVAWKDGYFRFDNASLAEIMRQFSRWYDVEVIYQGHPGEHAFNGKITRQANLSRVLKILSLGGLNFKIDKNKLTVLP